MKNKYVLKNKKRFSSILVIILLIVFSVIFSSTAYGDNKKVERNVVLVNHGDTLWSLSEKYKGEKDIREYIYDLKEINGLSSSEIKAGTELLMP